MEGQQKIQQGKFCLISAYDNEDHGDQDLEMILEEADHEQSTCASSFDGSDLSASSSFSSSSDFLEDDASSSTSSHSNEPLFDLSDLMSNLPIKRGLSKFYQGKSQSFTSLASVTSLEDLAKKVNDGGYGRRLKACKSYGGGLNLNSKQRSSHINTPKPTISKKSSSSSSSFCLKGKIKSGGSSFLMSN